MIGLAGSSILLMNHIDRIDQPALIQYSSTMTQRFDDIELMRDDDDGHVIFMLCLVQYIDDFIGGILVQSGCWLITQKDLRTCDQCPAMPTRCF